MTAKSKSALAVILFLLLAATAGVVFYQKTRTDFQRQLAQLSAELQEANAKLSDADQKLAQLQSERDRYKTDAAEVLRLRGEISSLKTALKAAEQKLAAQKPPPQAARAEPVPQMQNATTPPAFTTYQEMAQFAGNLRKKAFSGQPLTDQEKQWLQQARPELEKLERLPAEFAEFQSSLIQSAAGINDPQKVEQIRQIIQRVYEGAVARNLDIPSRPADDQQWKDARHQLDRRGTSAVQNLLSESERAAFDRVFIGIMGVDLGTGVDRTLYPDGFLGGPVPGPRQ